MAKLAALPETAIISGYKGTLDFYYWRGIPTCRAWPRSPGHQRAAAVKAQWPIFTAAAREWPLLSKFVQDAYRKMASGSTLSGRDMAIKMYINAQSILPY